MDFTSLDQLSAYLNSSAGQNTMTTNGVTVKEIVTGQAEKLMSCIQKRLDDYYSSRSPSVYNRTYGLQNSMSVSDFIDMTMVNGTATIKIDFDAASIASHSIFGGSDSYNTVELINSGWQVRDDIWFANIDHFGHQDGAHFIENGIADFNADNPYNLKIELQGFHS